MNARPATMRKYAEPIIFAILVWVLLDEIEKHVGRAAAWGFGVVVLLIVVIALYRRWRK